MPLGIETKVDSPDKLAAVSGKPTEHYLFADEFNQIVQKSNELEASKADLVGGKVPLAQLPTFVDFVFTIELIDYLTVDFYAPAKLKINSIEQISSTPSIDILVSDDPYTLGDLINTGRKITIISDSAGVINLKGNYE